MLLMITDPLTLNIITYIEKCLEALLFYFSQTRACILLEGNSSWFGEEKFPLLVKKDTDLWGFGVDKQVSFARPA